MPNIRQPRSGSMQVWPRKRARRIYPKVRSWAVSKEPKPLGFAGYKAGMTHVMVTDNRKNSITKGDDISVPVTIIECPALRVSAIRFYKHADDGNYGLTVASEIPCKPGKDLSRKTKVQKKPETEKRLAETNLDNIKDITLIVHTQPRLAGIGKKKPEVFELAIGGSPD